MTDPEDTAQNDREKKWKTKEGLIIAIFTHAPCEIAQQKSLKGDQLQIKPLSHFKEQPNTKILPHLGLEMRELRFINLLSSHKAETFFSS